MTTLRVIRGGKGKPESKPPIESPAPIPVPKFDDPLSKEQRREAAEFSQGLVGLVPKPQRGNVASSLVASVEWALAARVDWSDFVRMARNEYIKGQARRKPGPVSK